MAGSLKNKGAILTQPRRRPAFQAAFAPRAGSLKNGGCGRMQAA